MSRGSIDYLIERARMLDRIRSFFRERKVLEVDCCALRPTPSLDAHIDALAVDGIGYLHTSPEYAMKRLLAKGSGDIFYLGHVFRKEESGRLHSVEFSMVEWYRLSFTLEDLIAETLDLIRLFVGPLPARRISYRDAFLAYADVAPENVREIVPRPDWDHDACLHYAMGRFIEPQLGRGELVVLSDYPPSQAALARIAVKKGHEVAERFEIYSEGVELCNGYHELADAAEQKRRFEAENRERVLRGKPPYPIDNELLEALALGLPDCSGVSVGFDRLMMLRLNASSIENILAIPFNSPAS